MSRSSKIEKKKQQQSFDFLSSKFIQQKAANPSSRNHNGSHSPPLPQFHIIVQSRKTVQGVMELPIGNDRGTEKSDERGERKKQLSNAPPPLPSSKKQRNRWEVENKFRVNSIFRAGMADEDVSVCVWVCVYARVRVCIPGVELRTHTIRDRNRSPLILGIHGALSSLNRVICAFNKGEGVT